MIAVTLDTTVATFVGEIAENNPAIWTGSLSDFWRDNTDQFPRFRDLELHVIEHLRRPGFVVIGGGAEGQFTLATKEYCQSAAKAEDDDGCPKGDPGCHSGEGDCHDTCEAPAA